MLYGFQSIDIFHWLLTVPLSPPLRGTTVTSLLLQLLQEQIEHAKRHSDMPDALHGTEDISALQLLSIIAAADFRTYHVSTMEVISLHMHLRPMYVHRYIKVSRRSRDPKLDFIQLRRGKM